MADIVDRATRSKLMSRVRSANTAPEMTIRRALHRCGLRYQLHVRDLPGTPDLVFPKYRAAMFVHGCFWHGHSCDLFRMPTSNQSFWIEKIGKNRERDDRALAALDQQGWRVLVVWECAVRDTDETRVAQRAVEVMTWLKSTDRRGEITGRR